MSKMLLKVFAVFMTVLSLCGCRYYTPSSTPPAQQPLEEMDDDSLFIALMPRFLEYCTPEELSAMDDVRRTMVIAVTLDAEVNNGGLCQFFINYPDYAPYVPDCLSALGAQETLDEYKRYLKESGIDLSALPSTPSINAFTELYEKYPSDSFDDKYAEGEVYRCLIEYSRAHLGQLGFDTVS